MALLSDDVETKVRGKLVRYLRKPGVLPPGFMVFRHENRPGIDSGQADVSVSGNYLTTWLEVKLADPYVRKRGIQTLTMKRLGNITRAFYVIYYESLTGRETHIVHPSRMDDWPGTGRILTGYALGFNHQCVANFIRETHA